MEDLRSDCDCNAMLARSLIHLVGGALTGCWDAVDDGDAVFVGCRLLMALVTNSDVAVEE
jgi:hypothetical protein